MAHPTVFILIPALLYPTDTRAHSNPLDDAQLTTNGIIIAPEDTMLLLATPSSSSVNIAFPTYKAIWCKKYELSQAGYRDFLNALTLTQQTARTAAAPTGAAGTAAFGTLSTHNFIQIATPSIGGAPAVYGCNANSNSTYNESDDGEWEACNFLSWMDAAAYLDWSGLAPMTEIEYERICRGYTSAGPVAAVQHEYAWGTAAIYASPYTRTNAATASEAVSNASATAGNAAWRGTQDLAHLGQYRNGIFATAASNRITSGSAFFGVMEMSGNLDEYTITVGSAAGRSTGYVPNGDGSLSSAGNAQLSISAQPAYWPGMEGNSSASTANTCSGTCEVTSVAGIRYGGGNFLSNPSSDLYISNRGQALPGTTRQPTDGCRGVLRMR